MKKHLLVIFILAIVAVPGDTLAENSANPVEDTESSQGTNPPASYQDENIAISFIRAYVKHSYGDPYYFLELEVKVLSDHKMINPKNMGGYQDSQFVTVELADNFGNSLGFDRRWGGISPKYEGTADEKGLRKGQDTTFTIKFTDLPLESTEYLILKIPMKTFGNIVPFELKIKDFKPIVIKTEKQLREERRLQAEQKQTDEVSGGRLSRFALLTPVVTTPKSVEEKPSWISILITSICSVLFIAGVIAGVPLYRRILPKIICCLVKIICCFVKSFKYIFLSFRHLLWSGIILFVIWCFIAAVADLYIRIFLPIALAIISLTAGGMYTLYKKSDEQTKG